MKKILFVFSLLFASQIYSSPIWYEVSGTITSIQIYAPGSYPLTYEVGDAVKYIVEVDYEKEGYHFLGGEKEYVGNSGTRETFYANVSGDLFRNYPNYYPGAQIWYYGFSNIGSPSLQFYLGTGNNDGVMGFDPISQTGGFFEEYTDNSNHYKVHGEFNSVTMSYTDPRLGEVGAVPEPATLALFGLGMVSLAGFYPRKSKQKT